MVSPWADPLPVSALSDDGVDRAYLYDSSGDDLFTSSANSTSITNGANQLTQLASFRSLLFRAREMTEPHLSTPLASIRWTAAAD